MRPCPFLDALWRDLAGLPPRPEDPPFDYEARRQTEWSPQFEALMRNRLIMGSLRYGTLEQKRNGERRQDNVGAILRRAQLYADTGNAELLVDIANIALVEFEAGQHTHPLFHFTPTDQEATGNRIRET